ncbi:transposable element Tcb1 transposase [Trichonephila clavipes]|nr:transposable element Tcb1 transposase [Trichonephila clavipes]
MVRTVAGYVSEASTGIIPFILVDRDAISTEFALMDDTTRLHLPNNVNECLQSEFITPIEWPSFSRGLNPAQRVWHMLSQRVSALQPRSACVPELRRALLAEGSNIPLAYSAC